MRPACSIRSQQLWLRDVELQGRRISNILCTHRVASNRNVLHHLSPCWACSCRRARYARIGTAPPARARLQALSRGSAKTFGKVLIFGTGIHFRVHLGQLWCGRPRLVDRIQVGRVVTVDIAHHTGKGV
mmetsp:Transcript_36598/g.96839  ORF Transcript_36598/g.96839 Transcript_36598/m.96839 type:complete len:129 (-) Transcript_36598:323-709(-)